MSHQTLTDHNALIGGYPFRALPDPSPARLVAEMDRLGIGAAWTGHLPSLWYRDAAAGNDELFAALAPWRPRLLPVPAVNPVFPGWEREIERAHGERCPAVRTYPSHFGFTTAGAAMGELTAACAEAGLVLVLTMRLEDGRQRSRLDVVADLIGADVRNTVRSHDAVRLLVTNADRAIVEEVHWGSTPAESSRIRWDISWIWAAPEDHLQHLYRTVGRERFVFGTHFPLRLHENALARLELAE
jgi:predicted TIM-barrel fold metal-dependent hydrolase